MDDLKISDFEDLGLNFITTKKEVMSFKSSNNQIKGLIALYNTSTNLLWISAEREDYKPYATLVNSIQINNKEELQWLLQKLYFRTKPFLSCL